MRRFFTLLCAICKKFNSIQYITGDADDIYMIRYILLRSPLMNIYIHIFLRSDKDDLHDHPWDFVSYLIHGSYMEVTNEKTTMRSNYPSRYLKRNRLVFRKATTLHRVGLYHGPYSEKDGPMTLCITGPHRRKWGFVKDGKWIHWKKYLGVDQAPKKTV